jgi:HSP20 family protein
MQDVSQALSEVKELYKKILGRPAPDLEAGSFISFPPGVDPLNHVVHEVRHLRHLSEQVAMAPRPVAWLPLADCFASKDAFLIRLEVAGIERKDLKVFVAGGECLVRGERKQPKALSEMRPLALEQPWGSFERRFALPGGSQPDKVTARYEEGVLEVHVPVQAREAPKETKVEVV